MLPTGPGSGSCTLQGGFFQSSHKAVFTTSRFEIDNARLYATDVDATGATRWLSWYYTR